MGDEQKSNPLHTCCILTMDYNFTNYVSRNTMAILCYVYHDKNAGIICLLHGTQHSTPIVFPEAYIDGTFVYHERRQQKTTHEQKEIYCSYMEQNPILCQTKHCDDSVQNIWENLVVLLNSTSGATHTIEEWKRVFDNWRYAVTYKLRIQKADIKKTGGGSPKIKKEIDKLEERAMACWGRIIVDGHKNVAVAGCSKFEPTYETEGPTTGHQQGDLDAEGDFEGVVYLDDVEDAVAPKAKRQRRSTTKILDDDFNLFLHTSEERKQVQTELICSKLDKISTTIDALTIAQNATTEAIKKLTEAIRNSNFVS